MIIVYRIRLLNPELSNVPPVYYTDKPTAEMAINAINSMAVPGGTFQWELAEIQVFNREEAITQLTEDIPTSSLPN